MLGPLEVVNDGRTVALGGPRQRAVLAALLLRANRIADVGYLAATVWDRVPVAPESNIRTYVARLRRALDGGRLATVGGGYRLGVLGGELDLEEFVDAARSGEHAARRGELGEAADHLARALKLWRGRLLSGQVLSPALAAEAARLDDLRLGVVERYASVRIELGEPDAVVGDLRALVVEHPLREELWVRLIHALHRSGRRAEALAAFAGARRALLEELGMEPGVRLRQVQQEVLAEPASHGPVRPSVGFAATPKWW